tara:strand:+ start:546 stop:2177 length:1632 start_codon:yes stop_codon:yes gene_type:complete
MTLKNSLIYVNQFFFFVSNQFRKIYLNSNIYNKKISKGNINNFIYKPSPSLLDCLIKYSKKKNNINDFSFNEVWSKKNLKEKDFKNLHNFFWLFALDLNSSKNEVQSIILNWIDINSKYHDQSWSIDILSKRIIAWISNSKITYENGNEEYKKKFDELIKRQINHLINEIDRSKRIDDKVIGCSAIILTGLAYDDKKKFLDYGLNLLKKIIKFSFDKNNFPKSRNIRQLNFFLKYFILIREWLKESQNDIPEYLDEIIFYLGQSYNLIHKNVDGSFLFNGNQLIKNFRFENYLKRLGYNFKSESNETGGYIFLKNNKYALAMDVGSPPEKKFSNDYQAGPLSFEFLSNKKKVIINSGYFQNYKHQLNFISKTTACQSTLSIQNHSTVQFNKMSDGSVEVDNTFKINDKKVFTNKDSWLLEASHDGFNKRFGIIHHRKIEFFHEKAKMIGTDKILKKPNFKPSSFEIRFHLDPESKIMKTQDGKTIYIDINNEGWKFTGKNCNINFETGLFFGLKNNFIENQNIVISGTVSKNEQKIIWELEKI